MFRIYPRTLAKAALLTTALLMAVGGSEAAFASQVPATASVTNGIHSTSSTDSLRSRSGQVTKPGSLSRSRPRPICTALRWP
jgi:hypothetical protein